MGKTLSDMTRYLKPPWKRLATPILPKYVWDGVTKSLQLGWWDYGPRAKCLEGIVADILGIPHRCVFATRSCTDALAAAWEHLVSNKACQLPGVTSLTYGATYAWPPEFRFVDVDDDGWPKEYVEVGTELWGRPWPHSDYPQVLDSAYRLLAPEHGSLLAEGKVKAICYSLGPQKEAPCIMGGLLCVSPHVRTGTLHDIFDFLKCATHDRVGRPSMVGIKGLMPDPMATMARYQIRRCLRYYRQARIGILRQYERRLGKLLVTRNTLGGQAVIRMETPEERELVREMLVRHKVEHAIHYSIPEEAPCPNAIALSQRVLSLPLHAAMVPFDATKVSRLVVSA